MGINSPESYHPSRTPSPHSVTRWSQCENTSFLRSLSSSHKKTGLDSPLYPPSVPEDSKTTTASSTTSSLWKWVSSSATAGSRLGSAYQRTSAPNWWRSSRGSCWSAPAGKPSSTHSFDSNVSRRTSSSVPAVRDHTHWRSCAASCTCPKTGVPSPLA